LKSLAQSSTARLIKNQQTATRLVPIGGALVQASTPTPPCARPIEAARAAGWDAEVFTSASALIDALDRRGLNLGL
jgi:hypothetical protein